jgi:hypothetical protein
MLTVETPKLYAKPCTSAPSLASLHGTGLEFQVYACGRSHSVDILRNRQCYLKPYCTCLQIWFPRLMWKLL